MGIEEEDAEIIANGVDEVTDAVTNRILGQHTHKDKTVALLLEDIKWGQLREELKQSAYKKCFTKFSSKDGVILRDTRLATPAILQQDIFAAAHEGHPEKIQLQQNAASYFLCSSVHCKFQIL